MKVRLTIQERGNPKNAIYDDIPHRGSLPKKGQNFPIDGLGDPQKIQEVRTGDGVNYDKELTFLADGQLLDGLAESQGWCRLER